MGVQTIHCLAQAAGSVGNVTMSSQDLLQQEPASSWDAGKQENAAVYLLTCSYLGPNHC